MKKKISTRESLNREFLCRKCNTWILNSRDLILDTLNLENGEQYRKYICFECGEIHEFEGIRYLNWFKIGKAQKPKRKTIAERFSEKTGLSLEVSKTLVKVFG